MQYKLESLRGIAACMVVLYHSPYKLQDEPTLFFSNAYLFVDFFFVLSGFVMALAYGEKIRNRMPFGQYLGLRLGRLYPLHLFVLLLYIPWVLLRQWYWQQGLGGEDQFVSNNLATFVGNLFLVHSMGLFDSLTWNGPSWSISTEVFAYIAFFIFTITLDRRESLLPPLLISFACYGVIISLNRPTLDITYDFGIFRCIGAFYLGVFVYRLRIIGVVRKTLEAGSGVFELLCFAFVIVAVSIAELQRLFFVFPILSFALAILAFSSGRDGPLGRLLNGLVLRKVGLWSYSVYMLHMLIVGIFAQAVSVVFGLTPKEGLGIFAPLINFALLALIIFLSRYTFIYIEAKYRNISKEKLKRKYSLAAQTRT